MIKSPGLPGVFQHEHHVSECIIGDLGVQDLDKWEERANQSVNLDILRWRALMSSERIRVMGGSGFDYGYAPPRVIPNQSMHIGMEFWDKHPSAKDIAYPQEKCRAWFVAYVDELVRRRYT